MTTLERIKEKTERAMPSRAEYFRTEQEFAPQRDLSEIPFRKGADFSLYVDNEELQNDIDKGNPDLLPTSATLKMLGRKSAPKRPFDNEHEITYKVNSKGKLLFSLYAVVVLSLILVIVLNAIAIERQNAQNAQLQDRFAALNQTVEILEAQNTALSNEEYIISQAESLGMVPVQTQTVSISIPSPAQAAKYQPVTNWFDWLCDFLSLK